MSASAPPTRRLGGRTLLSIAAVFIIIVAVGLLLRDPVSAAGKLFVEYWGTTGVALGTMAADSSPFPIPHEPVLFLAIAGGLSPVEIFIYGTIGSLCAAVIGFTSGRILHHFGLVRRILGRHYNTAANFVEKYGATGVALAAITPIPYGICNWAAGGLNLPVKRFALASTVRILKVLLTVWLILAGWNIGAP